MVITILVVMSKISLNLGLIKRQDYKEKKGKIKKTFCISHYIRTFRRKRTALLPHILSNEACVGDHHRTIDIKDSKMLHQQTLLAWLMESLAINRLYARDHNTDYVSTSQRKKAKKKKRKERKKKRKKVSERADSLLRCLHAPR